MNQPNAADSSAALRPPIAILGVPFDNVTKTEAIELIEGMIASRKPHYLVTPNVDFLVQARKDVELRRVLFEAHLVLCDGTPLVWASRLLGNPLPERVAGADLVPLLIQVAALKRYRLFLLGAEPESALCAVTRLKQEHPGLNIVGHYSPPFNRLLEMDHDEIKDRIIKAEPDLLFVSFGCPKQEKWVAMHYRQLGVPVTAGVGATIDFLGGQMKRAPIWMQRSGTEWVFRLAQEPPRLFRRYATDLWVFSTSILPQWWELRSRSKWSAVHMDKFASSGLVRLAHKRPWHQAQCPARLDLAGTIQHANFASEILDQDKNCVLDMRSTVFVDSTGVGWLIRMYKRLHAQGRQLVLLSPTTAVRRALNMMRVADFFQIARNELTISRLLHDNAIGIATDRCTAQTPASFLRWHGEITAANAEAVWESTQRFLMRPSPNGTKKIDLSKVRFIDSTGLGLMVRAKKSSLELQETLHFVGLQPPVRNVLRLARLEDFLLGHTRSRRSAVLAEQ
jgi:N-acetylglucosaminyldiphosphoundecaprenol N-acetyl-beta-D-mannosaminyltransferase